jgi:hypothetical protein
VVFAHRGFIDQERQGVLVLTPKRSNQKQQAPLQSCVVNAYRLLIETVFSQLVDHMHLEDLGS